MTEYFFTADLHLSHANIIKYTNRPFKSIGEMNYRLIQNWNNRVSEDDVVFHIGDFCYKSSGTQSPKDFAKQLKGTIIFLRGNHDNNNSLKTCIEDIRINLGGKNILLVHNPNETTWGFDLCLVGHLHNRWLCKTMTFEKYRWDVFNVGVDVNQFRPVTINEILEKYEAWKRGSLK